MTIIRVVQPGDVVIPDTREVFYNANESMTSGGEPLPGLGEVYYAAKNTEITITAEVVNGDGDIQTQIDQTALAFPPVLKLPVNKYIGGESGQVVDEVYFNATLVGGILTATGEIPTSGDWKLTTDRLNKSIEALNGDFKIERKNITFLI